MNLSVPVAAGSRDHTTAQAIIDEFRPHPILVVCLAGDDRGPSNGRAPKDRSAIYNSDQPTLHPPSTKPHPTKRKAMIPMAEFHSVTTVTADATSLFDYLSDVSNLPKYFTRMTSAEPDGDGDEVHTTAQAPNGQQVEGDAWFRVDQAAHKIEWGSEGPSSYHGSLEVSADSDTARVDVHLHTTRVPDGDHDVQHGLEETLANIKRLVEQAQVG